jgi:hypothetical protein
MSYASHTPPTACLRRASKNIRSYGSRCTCIQSQVTTSSPRHRSDYTSDLVHAGADTSNQCASSTCPPLRADDEGCANAMHCVTCVNRILRIVDDHSTMIGIRHKCLRCPDYDVCTTCLGLGGHSDASCLGTSASLRPRRFAPMYERYDKCHTHREAIQWHEQDPPIKTRIVPTALQPVSGRILAVQIHERWHKDLADDKGYDSEPDEDRRTVTQYRKLYAWRKVHWFDGGHALRARARSSESLELSFALSRP